MSLSVMRSVRTAGTLTVQLATSGAGQDFLGAPWVARVVNTVPGADDITGQHLLIARRA